MDPKERYRLKLISFLDRAAAVARDIKILEAELEQELKKLQLEVGDGDL